MAIRHADLPVHVKKLFTAREAAVPAAFALAAVIGLMSFGARAADVTGGMALTTDYVWRGTTQTQGDPAAQAWVKVAGDSGVYASVWGSNVEFAPEIRASSEFDFTLGWSRAFDDDWAVDVNLLHYRYPATTFDLNWTEINGTVTYAGNYWASLGYSNEVFGIEKTGVYALVGARFPVSDTLRFEAAVAHYALDDLDDDGRDDDYAHGQLSAIWAFKAPFEARLTAHATDSKAKAFFGEAFAGDRIEAALQASF